MNDKEVIDALLKFFELIISCFWPFVIFLIIFLFRKEIRALLPKLTGRIKKVEIAGSRFEFGETTYEALQEAIETGVTEYKDDPDSLKGFIKDQFRKAPQVSSTIATYEEGVFKGRLILWVDDNPMNNLYESSYLKLLGADVLVTRTTGEALAFLSQDSCDLIISDIFRVENGVDKTDAGYELLTEVHNNYPKLPLVFYTGSVARVNVKQARYSFGVADYPGQLFELVFKALGT